MNVENTCFMPRFKPKLKPVYSIICDGKPIYDNEMSAKDLLEKHALPVQALLDYNIVEPRVYKKISGRNRYQTIYRYTKHALAGGAEG